MVDKTRELQTKVDEIHLMVDGIHFLRSG